MRERLINRRQQGDLGEASAIEWLTRQGATVSVPLGHSPDYDLIAEFRGRLFRVQVKTSTRHETTANGSDRWSVGIRTNGGNQSWTGITKRFDPTKVDALFVLVGDGRRWFIPAANVEGTHALRLGGSKYSEFEIEPGAPITPLVYGAEGPHVQSDFRAGECPSGQRMHAVNVPAYAYAGSNPASPIRPKHSSFSDGDTTRFERALGRSAQIIVRPKRQMTLPKTPFREAGLRVGDRLRVRARGPGRIAFERIETSESQPPSLLDPGA